MPLKDSSAIGANDLVQGLVVDGIIGGLGAVLGFVPQMAILFLFLSILEDCGYMVRIAFVMDRVFRHSDFPVRALSRFLSLPAVESLVSWHPKRSNKTTTDD